MVKDWPAGDKPVNNKAAAGTVVGKAIATGVKKVGRGAKKVVVGVAKAIHKGKEKYKEHKRKEAEQKANYIKNWEKRHPGKKYSFIEGVKTEFSKSHR